MCSFILQSVRDFIQFIDFMILKILNQFSSVKLVQSIIVHRFCSIQKNFILSKFQIHSYTTTLLNIFLNKWRDYSTQNFHHTIREGIEQYIYSILKVLQTSHPTPPPYPLLLSTTLYSTLDIILLFLFVT